MILHTSILAVTDLNTPVCVLAWSTNIISTFTSERRYTINVSITFLLLPVASLKCYSINLAPITIVQFKYRYSNEHSNHGNSQKQMNSLFPANSTTLEMFSPN